MKIVFKIIKSGSGNDVYFQNLAKCLAQSGAQVKFEYYAKYFQYLPFLLKFVSKKTDADIVHSNAEYGWALKEMGKPLFVSVLHLNYSTSYQKVTSIGQKLFHYLVLWPNLKLSLLATDKIFAISIFTATQIEKVFNIIDKVQISYPRVDTAIFRKMHANKYNLDGKYHLIFVGNLSKRKGADLLPTIMQKLGGDYVLHYTAGLRAKHNLKNNLPNMIPLPKLSIYGLAKEYNRCDALLFPTRLEGFGYAAAEAISCGIPIVSNSTSSIAEIVTHGKDGLLAKRGEATEYIDLIKRVQNLTFDMQGASEKIVKNFSVDKVTNDYLKEYLKVI